MIIMTKFWSQMSLPARKIRRRMAGCATPVAALVAVSVLAISCGGAKHPPAAQPSTPPQPTTTTMSSLLPQSTSPSLPRSSPVGRPMKQLAVPFGTGKQGVTVLLTVPRTWQLSKTQSVSCCSEPPTRCVAAPGSEYAGNVWNCRLTVTFGPAGFLSPNDPPAPPQQGRSSWSTTQESNWAIAGRQGEYRRFANSSGAESELWTIMTGPQIAFWHSITPQSDHALVAGIVDSAVLPPQTDPHRQSDIGYIRQISKRPDGYHLRLDRVVPNLDGTVTNINPATYDYRLDGDVTIPQPRDRCDRWEDQGCNMAYLLSQFAKGPHPADGSQAVEGAYVHLRYVGAYEVAFGDAVHQ
jgi:hypothetical protein